MKHMIVIIFFLSIGALYSQSKDLLVREDAVNVFIDCNYCDIDFIRDEIQFVNFVRDRKYSDIHVLFSRQRTGAGGRKFTLTFIGQNEFSGLDDTLTYSTNPTDTENSERIKLVKVLKLGLIPYISNKPIAKNIRIVFKASTKNKKGSTSDSDWNYWVYRVNFNSHFNGEKSSNGINGWGGVSARRVTEDSKIYTSASLEYNESNFDYDDINIKNVSRRYRFRSSYIGSMTEHFSWGIWANYYSSTYNNLKHKYTAAPGIEYNFYPYAESTRKQIRLSYKLSPSYRQYFEETIYFKNEEFLLEQSLSLNVEIIQPWGSIDVSLRGGSYLHDFSKNSFQFHGGVELQLFKGLSLDFNAGLSAIHNQLTLPKSDASIDDVLLRQRELATNFSYWGSFGFSYSFGSIYNNIVNPRFGD